VTRFRDDGTPLAAFADEFLVVCPRCAERALVRRLAAGRARFTCGHCGRARPWRDRMPGATTFCRDPDRYEPGMLTFGAPVDPCFHLPLWLQVDCCGERLWAFNRAHVDWLCAYVQAGLRQRSADPRLGWANAGLASRLPRWLKAAANRDAVLQGLRRLRALAV
jgi:hypothetical protein